MGDLPILYEDDHLIAIDKPAGIAVIAGRGLPEEPLQRQVEDYLKRKALVIHRLDRDASGIVLFAKDAKTHRDLCLQFETRAVQKKYAAIVLGALSEAREIDAPIRTFGSGRMGVGPKGKPSLTRYQVLKALRGATLLDVDLITGRRHQIRVHLYSIGHPILGDARYGSPRPVGGVPRLMLHARELTCALDGAKPLKLRSELPPDFCQVLSDWTLAPEKS